MRPFAYIVLLLTTLVSQAPLGHGQEAPTSAVPNLIHYSGIVVLSTVSTVSPETIGVTFAIYRQQDGGAPLWLETQNITPDSLGRYTVLLGSTKSEGIPPDLFSTNEERWLGVQVQGQNEQARVLMVSVPYALKSRDAETLGGFPATAFAHVADDNLRDPKAHEQESIGVPPSSGTTSDQQHSNNARPPVAQDGPTDFSGSTTGQIVSVVQSGGGLALKAVAGSNVAVSGSTNGANAAGISGQTSFSGTTQSFGVEGLASGPAGIGVVGSAPFFGVRGTAVDTSGTLSPVGVEGVASSTTGIGVVGLTKAMTGVTYGVQGGTASHSQGAAGVDGYANSSSGQVYGVNGVTNSLSNGAAGVNGYEGGGKGQVYGVSGGTDSTTNLAAGVDGHEDASTGLVFGVNGNTNSTTTGAAAVNGHEGAMSGQVYGVSGSTNSTTNGAAGVSGYEGGGSGNVCGVCGGTNSPSGGGVFGSDSATSGGTGGSFTAAGTSGVAIGVFGQTSSPGGAGGAFTNLSGGTSAVIVGNGAGYKQIFQVNAAGDGFFAGNLNVTGKLTKGSGSFKIDHPLDPANKYLSHSFVESPDMMNVYNGNITTNKQGLATVVLPDYFQALNREFRYQLTVIGQFAQAIVAREIRDNRFTIKTNRPGVKVSWQVTGIRKDAYANAYRIRVEEEKSQNERGTYLHPELFEAISPDKINASLRP